MPGMGFGFGFGFHRRASGSGVAEWSPSDVDGLQIQFDADDDGALFQTTDESTPAGSGNNVGRWNDLSGNTNHITQATAGQRPVRQTSGGLWYVESDGIDDNLSRTAAVLLASPRSLTIVVGVRGADSPNDFVVADGFSGGSEHYAPVVKPNADPADKNRFQVNGSSTRTADSDDIVYDDTAHVVSCFDDAGTISFRVDGVASGGGDTSGVSFSALDRFALFALVRDAVAAEAAVDLFSLLAYDSVLSGDDLTNAENYVAGKSGVTLS